jgi:ATPase subunit of ABC transporter with duplicated ATPase domains
MRGVDIDAPGGRPLLRGLDVTMGHERVAIVGRNGVGKSTLLRVLAGKQAPKRGRVIVRGEVLHVPQQLAQAPGAAGSPGELRRRALERVRCASADLLLLDEPSRDLDAHGVRWLVEWVEGWRGALLLVSHDRRLLECFQQFVVVSEAGCEIFEGGLQALLQERRERDRAQSRKYVQALAKLQAEEAHNARVARRRLRKKNGGRVRELDRCPSRALLNAKRSYAQQSQGKRAKLQRARIDELRDWTQAMRRALSVRLPLSRVAVEPEDREEPSVQLRAVAAHIEGRPLFAGLNLSLRRQRLAITGPNGAGKSTLVDIIAGAREPHAGRVRLQPRAIAYVAQNAANWRRGTCLLEALWVESEARSKEEAAELLVRHEFPMALATRPLESLSPGERLRAALVCIFSRRPVPQLLVLDEPTEDLDLVGVDTLSRLLCGWRGALVVVSHDADFLATIGATHELAMGTGRAPQTSLPFTG